MSKHRYGKTKFIVLFFVSACVCVCVYVFYCFIVLSYVLSKKKNKFFSLPNLFFCIFFVTFSKFSVPFEFFFLSNKNDGLLLLFLLSFVCVCVCVCFLLVCVFLVVIYGVFRCCFVNF